MIFEANFLIFIRSYSREGQKVANAVPIFTIFVLFFILVMGSGASNWNVYGQSNETEIQDENLIQDMQGALPEDPGENIGEESLSKSDSTGNDSNLTENSVVEDQSNPANESPRSQPDGDCLFDPSLPKCAPDENGNCPEGFGMNEDERCFPHHERCPLGYHSHEDDESGKCIPDSVPCDPGYIMNPDFPSCEYKEFVCQKHPDLKECKEENNTSINAYNSGYSHGCSDAKISDPSNRYINQPDKGPSYHTPDFMKGYNNGFESCSGKSNQPNSSGTFKVIVQVTNQLSEDTYGGIAINVSNFPDNIFKTAYGLYFPAGQTISYTFTFKSSDVPVGTEFEVNLDYGDDYNQYIFGINTPAKKPEIVQFFIP
ncbi:hypothetical protein [Candidatus Nitrosocosmicus franklandus]|uniref:Uncharacterized protein n=1 Tax=Candidatus Nitrosocosmicus franklandianus TaxID=1798806 RepID=A0A484I5P5_9ARCH|nr:hypothetical protein [Candidatus Nitrosocosmicus franklandus]VFJ13008.1 conserved protein of unknown function [Candidatus Nitrosocosmicus franklandus]